VRPTSPRGTDRELDAVLRSGELRSARLGDGHRDLWAALATATRGGKRFRPALVTAAHDAFGGTAEAAAARAGAALELLHTAFVVHDDVIDRDDRRRGRPNVSGAFAASARAQGASEEAARRSADAAGILAGDLALVSAVRALAGCGATPGAVDRLLDLLDEAVHASAAGELADVRLGLDRGTVPVTVEEALRVAALKTAVYSFELPLRTGAVLAGAPDAVVADLGTIGRRLGIGFQLLDDLLGVFGDEARTGKSALSDLREGTCTVLVAHARTTPAWPELLPLLGDPRLGPAGAARARDLLTACGARDATQELADRHLEEALAAARRPDLPVALGAALSDLVADLRAHVERSLLPGAAPAGPAPLASRRAPTGALP
jgi:geranylgeranyl diphosphate synthase, type II